MRKLSYIAKKGIILFQLIRCYLRGSYTKICECSYNNETIMHHKEINESS